MRSCPPPRATPRTAPARATGGAREVAEARASPALVYAEYEHPTPSRPSPGANEPLPAGPPPLRPLAFRVRRSRFVPSHPSCSNTPFAYEHLAPSFASRIVARAPRAPAALPPAAAPASLFTYGPRPLRAIAAFEHEFAASCAGRGVWTPPAGFEYPASRVSLWWLTARAPVRSHERGSGDGLSARRRLEASEALLER